jgi:hypothetical protein
VTKEDGHDIANLHVKGLIKLDASGLMNTIKEAAKDGKEDPEKLKALNQMKPDIKDIKIDMTVKFDATEGIFKSSNGTSDVEMSMSMPGGDKMDMKIKQKISTEMKVEETK